MMSPFGITWGELFLALMAGEGALIAGAVLWFVVSTARETWECFGCDEYDN